MDPLMLARTDDEVSPLLWPKCCGEIPIIPVITEA
jgi:hypothetical protein